eukprot:CAMPEP_0172620866 /NCGR_PEP_ID=MMETSP1068-20121228/106944_1 /TAXON_ID=35684 /ORGANISM="Pseudopedinella elastica, Strain CCMP716" /LENGTH=176 /DNA_ID=CAMNT_0013428321 /DNA_START=101 /DNA_END=631 /DNA_ORIENTATION=+
MKTNTARRILAFGLFFLGLKSASAVDETDMMKSEITVLKRKIELLEFELAEAKRLFQPHATAPPAAPPGGTPDAPSTQTAIGTSRPMLARKEGERLELGFLRQRESKKIHGPDDPLSDNPGDLHPRRTAALRRRRQAKLADLAAQGLVGNSVDPDEHSKHLSRVRYAGFLLESGDA